MKKDSYLIWSIFMVGRLPKTAKESTHQIQHAGAGMRNDLIYKFRKFIELKARRRFVEGSRTLPTSGYAVGFRQSDPQLLYKSRRDSKSEICIRLHRGGYRLWD
ncbi:MAG: hypothetical protein CL681_29150 [Blastopirellula sp.]|nr:hypothetical protein [Blastopirellula sp.]